MTLFGIIWIFIMIFLLFKPTQYLVSALIFSSIFQATSVINISGRGIQPFFITELFFILKFLFAQKNFKSIRIDRTSRGLFLFLLVCIVSAGFYPEIFRGIEVYPGNLGIDENVEFGGAHLSYSSSNMIQSIFLAVHVITFYMIYLKADVIDTQFIWKSIIITVCTFIFLGFLQYLHLLNPSVPYPSSFIFNNEVFENKDSFSVDGQLGITRMAATFTEPSIAGAFIAASFWAFFPQKGLKFRCITLLLFICLIFNLSSTGMVTFLAGAIVYTFIFKRKILIWVALSICIVYYVIISVPSLNFILNGILLDKLNTGSGINRSSADLFSWNLFLDTYGLGVGLGSHRTSSFLFNTLSNIGFLGSLLWVIFISRLLKPLFKVRDNPEVLFVLVFSLVLLCGQIAGVSELNLGIMWMWIFVTVIVKDKYLKHKNNSHATV
ncbi:hypothetical protein J2X97_000247 [Epilithonimonas hungarica]|uniref:hypothetical protein n=1 Tax=Epilithonimonas hungarica TaxID=454006 RepID=UPI00277D1DAB|nr:hypothetical protein [Epilithonimonas hungarica]MDP9954610.1 hypothetical protein [Epilithonimonas hungarica]